MTESSFKYIIDQYRSKAVWQRNDDWEWEFKNDFLKEMDEASNEAASLRQLEKFTPFQLTGKGKSRENEGEYILIGKGYEEN